MPRMTTEIAACPPDRPMTSPRPFLFVHGGWHGPWCWHEHWAGYFRDAGHDAHAIQLRAHDRPGRHGRIWSTIRQHVAEVRERLADVGPRTVLVGHSMGGLIVQRVLEDSTAAAAGAVLLASVPRRGGLPITVRVLRREPRATLRALATADLWQVVASESRARQAFYTPDTPSPVVETTFARLQNESFRALVNMLVRPPRPAAVTTPVHVIAAEHDWFISLAEQADLANAYATELTVIAGSGHNLMLDRHWQQAADDVLQWAATLDERPGSRDPIEARRKMREIPDARTP
jgi:pimeloyl-ACP methyl ester carboxylesterase